ncbi:hypothetical protein [Streptomyces sp. NPDC056948]|uniref:hypothetical protein n=1 Tax=Streptomyces sp. NPDC056948 TaxID=3345975 RepID=UPI00363F8ADD
MNPWLILAALILAVAVVLVSRAVRPGTGARRGTAPLLRPIEALSQFEARCVAERRTTLHIQFATGGVMCLDCRTSLAGGGQ